MNHGPDTHIIRCLIRINSPVHIGCGEVYEPTGFILDEKQARLVIFDPTSFVTGLSPDDRRRFSEICSQGTVGSIMELYKFMRNRTAQGRTVAVCQGFIEHYEQVLQLPANNERMILQELNKFSINRTSFHPHDGRPYLPGSSVKGALRTAWLNWLASKSGGLPTPIKMVNKRGKTEEKPDARKLEERLLQIRGPFIMGDPFRLVKVSDFMPVGQASTRIQYAVNRGKSSGGETTGLHQLLEVIPPGTEFLGAITLEQPHPAAGITQAVSPTDLLKALKCYQGEKAREDKDLRGLGADTAAFPDPPQAHLLRLGHHSGAECLTVEGHRKIEIRHKKGDRETKDHATTLWLASEERKPSGNKWLKPFGWVALAETDLSGYQAAEKQEAVWQAQIALELAEQRDRAEAERQRLAEEKQRRLELARRQAEELAARAAEEERRRAELEALSPAGRDAYCLREQNPSEQQAYEIYARLDGYSAQDQALVALALKEYFANLGKWTKKQCSNKQWQKVGRLKEILGES